MGIVGFQVGVRLPVGFDLRLWFYCSCSEGSLLAGQSFVWDRPSGYVDLAGAVIAEEINFICVGELKDRFRRDV